MIHKKLESNASYGVNVNFDKTHVLLQLESEKEQVRVKLTSDEVDRIIEDLQFFKSSIIR